MERLFILVEGQTEEKFVNTILRPHLQTCGVYPIPIVVKTNIMSARSVFKGGHISYTKIKNEVKKLLASKPVCVTTMFDFYGLPQDFIGLDTVPKGSGATQVAYLEAAFGDDIDNHKFRPYLMLHEFEALLFTSPEAIATQLLANSAQEKSLLKIKAEFNSPEEINKHPQTAPSKRISKIFPEYSKTVDGPLIIAKIGLEKIRQSCTHFNDWLNKLADFCE